VLRGRGDAAGRRADRNLDEGTRDEIITLLERLSAERGLTIVLVTHDSTIARRSRRVAVMSRGRLALA
jgi:putative ABC transport system ATP-binding protein